MGKRASSNSSCNSVESVEYETMADAEKAVDEAVKDAMAQIAAELGVAPAASGSAKPKAKPKANADGTRRRSAKSTDASVVATEIAKTVAAQVVEPKITSFFKTLEASPKPEPETEAEAQAEMASVGLTGSLALCAACRMEKPVETGSCWQGRNRAVFKCKSCNKLGTRLATL